MRTRPLTVHVHVDTRACLLRHFLLAAVREDKADAVHRVVTASSLSSKKYPCKCTRIATAPLAHKAPSPAAATS